MNIKCDHCEEEYPMTQIGRHKCPITCPRCGQGYRQKHKTTEAHTCKQAQKQTPIGQRTRGIDHIPQSQTSRMNLMPQRGTRDIISQTQSKPIVTPEFPCKYCNVVFYSVDLLTTHLSDCCKKMKNESTDNHEDLL